MTAPLRAAIFSFAHMHAWSYAAALQAMPDVELVAIADDDAERLATARERFPQVPQWFEDYRDLLRSAPCDAAVITSPNVDHCRMTLDALGAGVHVLCEKPLATTVADGKRMIAAAREAGRTIMTAFPVRFCPAVVEAKKAIASGRLGRILGAAITNHGSMPGDWFVQPALSGGGAVMDHTVHVVDLLRWLFECEVVDVYAEYANRLHPDIACEDVGLLSFRMENGAVVTLDASWSRCRTWPIWGDVKLELRGEQGCLSLDCFPMQVTRSDDARSRYEAFAVGDNFDELMLREFVTAVRENRPPAVTGEDGLRALEVALAAYRAGRERRPVRIAEIAPG